MLKRITLALAMASIAVPAFAHVTLERSEAPVGTTYKAVLRVPHGCEGKPTNIVRVQVPEGMYAVKPMPKPGWKLEKVIGKYEKAYDNHGTQLTEGVKEVIWSGGNLADDEYDEFVLRGSLAGDLPVGSALYFLVVQECPEGLAERWIEIPAEGQTSDDLEMPAPALKLIEKTDGH
ncbi:YcnI family protein [Mesorhizobium sp. WSM2239]|uniref:YcnI family protein n=1 Tax=Mesorhizobium sp. WSM2239 TaxID=3228852 RepID=A0AAU8DH53_9HYPH